MNAERYLRSESHAWSRRYASGTAFYCEHRMDHEKIPTWEGIRDERYVYARYDGQDPPYEFLHDLAKDPYQLHNYARDEAHAATLAEFRKRTDAAVDRYAQAK